MARLLFKVGRGSFRHRWVVIIAWILILAGVGSSSALLQRGFNDLFSIPGMPSATATEKMVELFPGTKNPMMTSTVNIVFKAPDGHKLTEPQYYDAMNAVVGHIKEDMPGLTGTERFGNPVDVNKKLADTVVQAQTDAGLPKEAAQKDAENLAMLSQDEHIGYTTFNLDNPLPSDTTDEQRQTVKNAVQLGRDQGLTVEGGGPAMGEKVAIEGGSEAIGLAVAFVVLVLTFGSLVAAGLPLIPAVFSVAVGGAAITLATRWVSLNNTTPVLAIMLGLAVGIDYSLFILARYRAETRERATRDEAIGVAVGTAGSAVVFAGSTVFIALVALCLVGIPFLSYMGISAAFTVFIAVLASLTLIPAMLGVLRGKAFKGATPGLAGNRRGRKQRGAAAGVEKLSSEDRAHSSEPRRMRETMGSRWARLLYRIPALVLAVVVIALGALSLPVKDLQMALPMDSTAEHDSTQRKSADIMAEGFGPGVNTPFLVVIDGQHVNPKAPALQPMVQVQKDGKEFDEQKAAATSLYAYVAQQLSLNPDVKHAQIVGMSPNGLAGQVMVSPKSGPVDPQTTQLLKSVRGQLRSIEKTTGSELGVTGFIPIQNDVTQKLSDAMPIYLAVVVGLAFVLLILIFRSLVLPLVAALGFLLSVGAAFGVTVLFWQQGLWGAVPTPGPLISFMPIFLIGVTFGLAMDYQVFLGSHMREQYSRSQAGYGGVSRYSHYDAVSESVIVGITRAARVVTAAALIMIAVFVAFIGQPLPFVKIFGFALAVGVFFDAFLIRMGLVPAAMFLCGRATWWMPRWLERILPRVDVEGSGLEADREGAAQAGDTTTPSAASGSAREAADADTEVLAAVPASAPGPAGHAGSTPGDVVPGPGAGKHSLN